MKGSYLARILPMSVGHIAGYRQCVDEVARERRYLAEVTAFLRTPVAQREHRLRQFDTSMAKLNGKEKIRHGER